MKSQGLKPNIYNPKPKPKVFVGLSGGVDSAVSAALLKMATPNNFKKLFGCPAPKGFRGYEVTGVFIKAWTPEGYPCTWREDRRSAMRAAAVLDIPFITLDLEKEYKKEVVDYMIREYKEGRTPNPDVMCNKEIKFGRFLKFALDSGADFVATGHYAQLDTNIRMDSNDTNVRLKGDIDKLDIVAAPLSLARRGGVGGEVVVLKEGADKNKDQSYFLWTLTPGELKHILFPIGHLQKSEVRKLALKFGLPQATRKDSQGLCFLGKIDMKEFLQDYIKTKKGKVLLASRDLGEASGKKVEIIGEHDGALLYTIGERRGFSVNNRTTNSEPLYVVSKDIENNTITVAPKQKDFLQSQTLGISEVKIENMNLLADFKNKRLTCRIRYRQEKISCEIFGSRVVFDKPQFGVSPGQSIVFYDGEICLGGAIIAI